ncbi:MAG: hypothetical protein M3Q36_01315 [bacterium]|nr:hypothetical protein [bacterium]
MIIVHIFLAISALALSIYSNFSPSLNKLSISYFMAGGTLTSGILLIFINNASILRTCLSGIVFFAVVSLLNELARHKLVA